MNIANANISETLSKIFYDSVASTRRKFKIAEYAKGAISVAGKIVDFFVAIIVSIYILRQRGDIINFGRKLVRAMFKKDTYNNIEKYFNKTNEVFKLNETVSTLNESLEAANKKYDEVNKKLTESIEKRKALAAEYAKVKELVK